MADEGSADLRHFIREITVRIERAVQGLDRAINVMDRKTDLLAEKTDLLGQELRLQREEIRLQRDYLDDILAENRAQREALFRILDRLDDGGTAPAA